MSLMNWIPPPFFMHGQLRSWKNVGQETEGKFSGSELALWGDFRELSGGTAVVPMVCLDATGWLELHPLCSLIAAAISPGNWCLLLWLLLFLCCLLSCWFNGLLSELVAHVVFADIKTQQIRQLISSWAISRMMGTNIIVDKCARDCVCMVPVRNIWSVGKVLLISGYFQFALFINPVY